VTGRSARLLLDTLRLAGAPDGSAAGEAWSRVDAATMAALIAWEGGAQWLSRRLRETGLAEAAPPELREALRTVAMDEQARAMLVDAETVELERHLNERGVSSVLIKGPARRAAGGRFPYADARATLDVDVLLPASRVEEVWRDLRARGWAGPANPGATPPGHHHLPPLRGPNGVSVELHVSTDPAVAPEEAWRRATADGTSLEWHGVCVRIPSATELLWHGLTHALRAGPVGFRLRHFLDGASVLASGAAVDFDTIASRLAAGLEVEPRQGRAWLRSAAELAGAEVPAAAHGARVPFDLERAVAWRLAVFAHIRNARLAARLRDEGTRAELGLVAAPAVAGTGPFIRTRRWVAGRVARLVYRAWRVVRGR
jgi:hypothetical protein